MPRTPDDNPLNARLVGTSLANAVKEAFGLCHIGFSKSIIYDEHVGNKTYRGIVNSANNGTSVVIGRHVAILVAADDEGNALKIAEQDFETLEQATQFLQELLMSLQTENSKVEHAGP